MVTAVAYNKPANSLSSGRIEGHYTIYFVINSTVGLLLVRGLSRSEAIIFRSDVIVANFEKPRLEI